MPSPPVKDATKEEHKSFVETVEAALNRANKSIGLQGATEKARENTSAAVQAAKDSDFAEESMQKLHASWDSFASHCLPIAEGYNQVQDQTADMLKGLSDAATESADATRNAIEDFKESQDPAPESDQDNDVKSSITKTIGGAVNSAYEWTVDTAVPAVSDTMGQVADYFAPSHSKPGSESADDVEANNEKNQSGGKDDQDEDEAENSTAKAIGEDVVDKTQGLISGVSEWAGNAWQNIKDSEAVNATSNAIEDFKNENEDPSPETDQEATSKSGTIGGAMNSAYKWTVDTAVPAVSEKAGRIAHHFAPVRSKSGSVFADDVDVNDEEQQSGGNAASDQYKTKNSTIGETIMKSGHKWSTCAPRRSRSFASSRSGSDFAQLISA